MKVVDLKNTITDFEIQGVNLVTVKTTGWNQLT